jgi:hypothetical protein
VRHALIALCAPPWRGAGIVTNAPGLRLAAAFDCYSTCLRLRTTMTPRKTTAISAQIIRIIPDSMSFS